MDEEGVEIAPKLPSTASKPTQKRPRVSTSASVDSKVVVVDVDGESPAKKGRTDRKTPTEKKADTEKRPVGDKVEGKKSDKVNELLNEKVAKVGKADKVHQVEKVERKQDPIKTKDNKTAKVPSDKMEETTEEKVETKKVDKKVAKANLVKTSAVEVVDKGQTERSTRSRSTKLDSSLNSIKKPVQKLVPKPVTKQQVPERRSLRSKN